MVRITQLGNMPLTQGLRPSHWGTSDTVAAIVWPLVGLCLVSVWFVSSLGPVTLRVFVHVKVYDIILFKTYLSLIHI